MLAVNNSGGGKEGIWIWDLQSGELRKKFGASFKCGGPITVSPDGKRLACACLGEGAVFWDPLKGEEMYAFQWHGLEQLALDFYSVAFSPNGSLVATGVMLKNISNYTPDGR